MISFSCSRHVPALAAFALTAKLLASEPGYEVLDLLTAATPSDSRDKQWKPGGDIVLEISGMDWIGPDRLGVTLRKGDVYFIDSVLGADAKSVRFHRFASGLHEPLGLLKDGDSFLVTQRTEVTRLRDTDQDGLADEFLTAARGWNVSGNYHGYAYGPKRDKAGNLWITTNLDMGERAANNAPWRGWALTLRNDGTVQPMAAGLRSPCGFGTNADGEMFVTDQQGTWVPATPIHHLQKGAFYTNPEGIGSQTLPDSPLNMPANIADGIPYPEAIQRNPAMKPAAVWLPYNKMGRSGTDIVMIPENGSFGPFEGQLLVGEFTNSAINRVFLEKVDGQYQGACFPFLDGFPAAVVRLAFAPDGSLFVGMTNRGWSSLGARSYGLQRVRKSKSAPAPFAVRTLRATPTGFALEFTHPVDPATARNLAGVTISRYTYLHSHAYGSDEIDTTQVPIESAELSPDARTLHLVASQRKPLYVHELHFPLIRSATGEKLVHPVAYYTLNRIPSR